MLIDPKLNRTLSVDEAYSRLEKAVKFIIRRTEWSNPYSAFGTRYRAKINELRQPYVELQLAKKRNIKHEN